MGQTMGRAVLGIIGGSGIYDLPGLMDVRRETVTSPWGEPSGSLLRGRIGSTEIVFLPRHGEGHRLSPSGINYRANIDVLKRAGVTDVVALSACGSFRDGLPPGHVVLVDQFVDLTRKRETSFFGSGCVAHVSMAHPVGPALVARLHDAAVAEAVPVTVGGTYVCIEGPQFSSLAESRLYRAQGFDVIGMTAMPEAKLAREAELTYAVLALVTDFDCWHPEHDAVDVAAVLAVMKSNIDKARRIVARLAQDFPEQRQACPAGSHHALDHAIMTAPAMRDPALLAKLDAVAGRVL